MPFFKRNEILEAMKKILFPLVGVLCCAQLSSLAQLSLDSCQLKARLNYPAIKQLELIEKSKEFSLSNASKAYYPQFSLNALGAYIIQGLPTFPGSESTPSDWQLIGIGQVTQTIWDGGTTSAQKEIIRANARVDSASTDVSLYTLRDRVNQLYFGILLIDEQLKQLEVMNAILQRNLDAANLLLQNGKAYQSDVDQVKVEIIKSDQKKIQLNGSREAYVAMLSLMTGEKMDADEKFVKPTAPVVASQTTISRPELSLYESQRQQVDAQMKLVQVGYMPKINILGAGLLIEPGVNFGPSTLNSIAVAGLSVSWNTSGLYTAKSKKQITRVNLDKINNQQETFLFNTNLELTRTRNEIAVQQALLKQDEEIVALKESIRKSYETKFQNGMSSMNDLLEAESDESDVRSSKALHEIQLLMSMYNLETVIGNTH